MKFPDWRLLKLLFVYETFYYFLLFILWLAYLSFTQGVIEQNLPSTQKALTFLFRIVPGFIAWEIFRVMFLQLPIQIFLSWWILESNKIVQLFVCTLIWGLSIFPAVLFGVGFVLNEVPTNFLEVLTAEWVFMPLVSCYLSVLKVSSLRKNTSQESNI